MAQGIFGGILLGAVFSVGVAGVVSVLVPMQPQPAPQLGTAEMVAAPQQPVAQPKVSVTGEQSGAVSQPQVSMRAPVSEELPKEPPAAALAPQVKTELEATRPSSKAVSEPVTAPQQETAALAALPATLLAVDSASSDSTPVVPDPLPQPQTGTAADLTTPRPLPDGLIARAGEDAPVLPNPQALAPMIPDDTQDAEIAALADAPAEPVVQEAPAGELPAQEVAPQEPLQEGEEIFIVVDPAPAPADTPQTEETETASVVKPRVLTVTGTQPSTLGTTERPRIGTPANSLINRAQDAEVTPVETVTQAPVDPANAPPIQRFAQPFANPEGKPLMSIVLMDTGADLDAAEIGLPALSSFPYPVSFAVDVNLPDAAMRMQRFRAEGFDVLAIVDLPRGARPTDAEVSLSVALSNLNEVVGILEGNGEGFQGSREVADQVTRILKASGHGLVAQGKGLNSMPKLAVKEGVPAAPVFRDFDSEGQQARVIRRFLDQAAFKAGQEGGVIMLGRLRPETIEALLVWGLADRAGSVALAPVSAVLQAQR